MISLTSSYFIRLTKKLRLLFFRSPTLIGGGKSNARPSQYRASVSNAHMYQNALTDPEALRTFILQQM